MGQHFVCVSRSVVSDSLRPMDCSPPGSSVRGILQARTLGRVAMPSSILERWVKSQKHVNDTVCQKARVCREESKNEKIRCVENEGSAVLVQLNRFASEDDFEQRSDGEEASNENLKRKKNSKYRECQPPRLQGSFKN